MSAGMGFIVWFVVALTVFAVLARLNRATFNDLRNGPFVACFLAAYLWPVTLACLVVALPFVLVACIFVPRDALPTPKPGDPE